MATGKSGGLTNGYPWLSAVPSAWKARKVSSMCYVHGRIGFKGYSRQDLVSNEAPGAAVVFGGTNIEKNGTLDYEVLSFLSLQKYLESPEIALNGGEILMTKVGAGVGDCAIYDGRFERATINPNVLIIEPKSPDISADFLRYRLISSDAQLEIHRESTKAGAQPAINQAYVKRLRVSIPVLAEQQFIVEFLNRKTAEIDALIEKLSLQVELLERYRRELIAHTVTHGLDPDAPMRDSGIDWVGKIPQHWKMLRIASLYDERSTKVSDQDFLPLSVTMQGILPQIETVAKTNDGDNRKLIKKGDFVINSRSDRRGACGIADRDGSCSLINTVLRPQQSIHNPFFNYLFRSNVFADEFYKWGHGIVDDLWTTRWTDMKVIQVPVPPIAEQRMIAEFLKTRTAQLDLTILNINKQIELLGKYRKQVINDAVTGKVRVEGAE